MSGSLCRQVGIRPGTATHNRWRAFINSVVLSAHLFAVQCLKHLKAILSPHPYDLEPVEPVIEFQQAKYRFADPVDALAGIDSRPDLLKMDWYKFENLIRQLFEAMGWKSRSRGPPAMRGSTPWPTTRPTSCTVPRH